MGFLGVLSIGAVFVLFGFFVCTEQVEEWHKRRRRAKALPAPEVQTCWHWCIEPVELMTGELVGTICVDCLEPVDRVERFA